GGVIGGICLLAFLLSKGRAEETNGFNEYKFETPSDLKSVCKDNDRRSGLVSHSGPRSFGDS
ncbi:hypothetical protein HW555_007431, partial [Spodoptera exigua]